MNDNITSINLGSNNPDTFEETSINFSKRFQGYDQQEVDDTIDSLREEISKLKRLLIAESQNSAVYKEKLMALAGAARQIEDERAAENRHLRDLMESAHRSSDTILNDANMKATAILMEAEQALKIANLKAQDIINDAEMKANRMIEESKIAVEDNVKRILMDRNKAYSELKSVINCTESAKDKLTLMLKQTQETLSDAIDWVENAEAISQEKML